MNKQTTLLCSIMLAGLIAMAEPHCGDDHSCHAHQTSGFEIGLSVGYTTLDENHASHEEHGHHEEEHHGEEGSNKDYAPSLHVHISKRLAEKGLLSKFALGIGGEIIFADHEHYALMAPLTFYPWRGLVLSAAPGIEWAKHEDEWVSEYATHLEAAYVFEMDGFHIGPVIDYSKSDSGEHYTVGIHLGFHL